MVVPFYITLFLYVIIAIILLSVYYGLNYAYDKTGKTKKDRIGSLLIAGALLGGWMAITGWLAAKGHFLNFESLPPRILATLIPAALAISYITVSDRVKVLLNVIPRSWFINIQSFRVLMEIFLWLMYRNGLLPVQMTFEGRNFDLLIGLSAPVLANFCFVKKTWPKLTALLWNFAGLLLVTNVLIVAILSMPGPMRKFMNEPANTAVVYFPFIWIPALIVPFAYLMHILSIKQILSPDENKA